MRATLSHRSRHNGFTIIEIVVVIVIIAVLSSLAVPRYYHFAQRARFQESIQRVISVFSDARNRAVQSGSECVVQFDTQSATFVIELEGGATGTDRPVEVEESPDAYEGPVAQPYELADNVIISDFQLAETGTAASPTDRNRRLQIRFYEDGRADGARMTLLSEEGDRAAIEIAPLTGRASVVEDPLR